MATPGQTFLSPISGERIVFRETASETGGRKLVIDHFLPPHTDTCAEHVQFNQEERFEILSGTATYRLNGACVPITIQRLMIPLLGIIGRWLGYPARYSLLQADE